MFILSAKSFLVATAAVATMLPTTVAAGRLGGEKNRNAGELSISPEVIKSMDLHRGMAGFENAMSKQVEARKKKPATKQFGIGGPGSESNDSTPFNPETDDPFWPGSFPTNFGDDVMVNIRTDNFPGEIYLNVDTVFSPEDTSVSRSFHASKFPTAKQGGPTEGPFSLPVNYLDVPNSLYRIEIIDTAGDGICCNYGNGWITVTDRAQNVLWSATGDYSYIASVYLYLNDFGNFEVVGSTYHKEEEGDVGTSAPTSTGGAATATVLPAKEDTATPSVSPNPNPSPTPPPTFRPTFRPTARPTSPPTTSTITSAPVTTAGCELCDNGASVGAPFKTYELSSGDIVTCGEIEDVYELVFTDEDCLEADEAGSTDFYRSYCECPGVGPACTLCSGGGSVGAPSKELTLDDGTTYTCEEVEMSFFFYDTDTCTDLELGGTIAALAQFCEC